MTDNEGKILSEIVDLNYEINKKKKELSIMEHNMEAKQANLKNMMGEAAYDKMVSGFKKMFAPV